MSLSGGVLELVDVALWEDGSSLTSKKGSLACTVCQLPGSRPPIHRTLSLWSRLALPRSTLVPSRQGALEPGPGPRFLFTGVPIDVDEGKLALALTEKLQERLQALHVKKQPGMSKTVAATAS